MTFSKKRKNDNWKFIIGLFSGIIIILVVLAFSLLSSGVSFGNKIAVIQMSGTISSSPQLLTESVIPNDIFSMIDKVEEDPSIKGAIFMINSPGGSVVASREIAHAVKEMEKPTVCWMADVAASGAYWIASACDHVMADPLTMTGSIGVTASYLEFSELFDEYGVTYEQITSGERKDMGTPFRNMTSDERERMEYLTSEIFSYFLSEVVENRNLTQEQIDQVIEGDIFLGKDAVSVGLIDSTGTLKDAKDKAKELAGTENVEFYTLKKKGLGIFDLMGMF